MNPAMLMRLKHAPGLLICVAALAASASAQSAAKGAQTGRAPRDAARPFVVLPAQTLSDLERKLRPESKVEELFGGEGQELRVAVQHERNKTAAAAEVHDASDDVYYVLEGTATLTLGGRLDAPREIEPGEWRAPRIVGGRDIDIARGDLVVVPRGTPHMRSTVGKEFSMILIKIFADPVRAPQPATAAPPVKKQ